MNSIGLTGVYNETMHLKLEFFSISSDNTINLTNSSNLFL